MFNAVFFNNQTTFLLAKESSNRYLNNFQLRITLISNSINTKIDITETCFNVANVSNTCNFMHLWSSENSCVCSNPVLNNIIRNFTFIITINNSAQIDAIYLAQIPAYSTEYWNLYIYTSFLLWLSRAEVINIQI